MKAKTIVALVLAVVVIGSIGYYVYVGGFNPRRTLTLAGSTTVLPLAQAEAEKYLSTHVHDDIRISDGGSGVGIAALLDGTTDIAMSSRQITPQEIAMGQQKGLTIVETTIALDAVCVIVHPSNTITQLTLDQVALIYTGKYTNWKQLGGPDMAIVVYQRETTSGTYEVFNSKILKGRTVTASALSTASNGEMRDKVAQNQGAIGYVGLAYVDATVKGLSLAKDASSPYVHPSAETVREGSYAVSRKLYLYTNGNPSGVAKDFIDFILSSDGQNIVSQVGYISLKP